MASGLGESVYIIETESGIIVAKGYERMEELAKLLKETIGTTGITIREAKETTYISKAL